MQFPTHGSDMNSVTITIDDEQFTVPDSFSVRRTATKNGIYVPGLCSHPELNPFKPFSWSEKIWHGESEIEHDSSDAEFPHCNLCMVSIDGGEPVRACSTQVTEGMQIRTAGEDIILARKKALREILAFHPHVCLTCPQREGCDRVQCSMDVPVQERCCELLGRCEIGLVSDFVGIPGDTPAYRNEGRPQFMDEPLFLRDYELCIGCTRCVRVCRDVRGVNVLGAVLVDGRVKIGTSKGATLDESQCKFCTACVAVCPTGALRDHSGAGFRDNSAPCTVRCPLGIDVPGYIELIADGKIHESLELIREKAVLPGVLGYACFHPCEENCRRNSLDESISICALKRYASDIAGEQLPPIAKAEPSGKKVAVIGSGPAGLAAAGELLKRGHSVTVLERDRKIGGMLNQTIPEFRLPDRVIERDLAYLKELGMEIRHGVELGKTVDYDKLRDEGFNAIVVSVGLADAVRLGAEGENLVNVIPGLDFLRRSSRNGSDKIEGKVVVIGGGAVSVDAAMTARRLGGNPVTMVCLESELEIPAFKEELDAAAEEGIGFNYRWGVMRFEGEYDKVKRVILQRCSAVFDDRGKFNPQYNPDETDEIEADWVIVAIGQRLSDDLRPFIKSDQADVFPAGDSITGPTSIVAAMADGVRAAREVGKYFGDDFKVSTKKEFPTGKSFIGSDPNFLKRERVEMDHLGSESRIASMNLFSSTYSEDQAVQEAARCLRCHLRAAILPSPLPPDPWREFDESLLDEVPSEEGVLILADESKVGIKIAGAANLNALFSEVIDDDIEASYCRWELDPIYTQRESELIQAHLQAFGEMPGGDELDDLF